MDYLVDEVEVGLEQLGVSQIEVEELSSILFDTLARGKNLKTAVQNMRQSLLRDRSTGYECVIDRFDERIVVLLN